jgi:hypothetical protein
MVNREEILFWTRDAVLEGESASELICKILGSERASAKGGTEVVGSAIEGKVCCHLGSGTEEEMRSSRCRIRCQRMRPAGERAERNRTEPAGIEVSIANDDTLCSPVWEALFKAANRPCTTTTI